MNNYKLLHKFYSKKINILVLLIIGLSLLTEAQSTIASGGGNASSGGISVSYTIGQIFYSSIDSATFKVTEGVQQTYEILTATEIKEAENIKLIMNVFPNPTKNDLTLIIENYSIYNLTCSFIDISGKQLFTEQIKNKLTQIKISNYPVSTYFLKVFDKNKEIKTFKIIKIN